MNEKQRKIVVWVLWLVAIPVAFIVGVWTDRNIRGPDLVTVVFPMAVTFVIFIAAGLYVKSGGRHDKPEE